MPKKSIDVRVELSTDTLPLSTEVIQGALKEWFNGNEEPKVTELPASQDSCEGCVFDIDNAGKKEHSECNLCAMSYKNNYQSKSTCPTTEDKLKAVIDLSKIKVGDEVQVKLHCGDWFTIKEIDSFNNLILLSDGDWWYTENIAALRKFACYKPVIAKEKAQLYYCENRGTDRCPYNDGCPNFGGIHSNQDDPYACYEPVPYNRRTHEHKQA